MGGIFINQYFFSSYLGVIQDKLKAAGLVANVSDVGKNVSVYLYYLFPY